MSRTKFLATSVVLAAACGLWAACGGTGLAGDGEVEADGGGDEAGPDDGGPDDASDVREDAWPWETVELPATCGDGEVDPGEECDDGNRLNGDECDWHCRLGPGTFEYPPPDPAVPPLEPAGPPVEVVGDTEGIEDAAYRVQLAWSGGVYGLAYVGAWPAPAVRFRILHPDGAPGSGSWENLEAYGAPNLRLLGTDEGFALFTQRGEDGGVFLTRLGRDAVPLAARRQVLSKPEEVEWWRLVDAGWTAGRFAVLCAYPDLFESLHLFSRTGEASGEPLWFEPFYHWLLALPDGVALSTGTHVAILDLEPRVVGWSGYLAGRSVPFAAGGEDMRNIVATEEGFLIFWLAFPAPDLEQPADLWVAGFDRDGELTLPARIVLPALTAVGGGYTAVYGPAGVGFVYQYAAERTAYDREVRILNTDRWGNPRSTPATVVTADDGTYRDSGLEIAADDSGYGVVIGVRRHPSSDSWRFVFRRYVASSP